MSKTIATRPRNNVDIQLINLFEIKGCSAVYFYTNLANIEVDNMDIRGLLNKASFMCRY